MNGKNCCCDSSDCDDQHTRATLVVPVPVVKVVEEAAEEAAEAVAEELAEAAEEAAEAAEEATEEPVRPIVEVTVEEETVESTCCCENLIEEWKGRFKKGLDTLDNIIETELSEEKMKKALPFIIGAAAAGVAFAIGMNLAGKKSAK